MKMFIAAMLCLVLSACVPTKPDQPLTVHQRYEIACVGGGTSYAAIIAVNKVHTLTAAQQRTVTKAADEIDKRCKLAPGQDYPYTATQAVMDELEGAAGTLATIKEEVR